MLITIINTHDSHTFLEKHPGAICLDKLHANEACLEVVELLKGNENLIFVTTNGTIVNFFGHLIYEKYVDKDDVKVVLVHEDGETVYPYWNDEGILVDWPYGYFLPGCYDDLERLGLKKRK